MPTASEHRRKAEGNRKFLATVSIDDFPDWAAVVAFYTAVHLVEQLRASGGDGHSEGHEDRLAYVQARHPKIHSPYHVLQNVSMLARYQSNSAFFAQFQPETIREKIVETRLVQVEEYTRECMDSQGSRPAN